MGISGAQSLASNITLWYRNKLLLGVRYFQFLLCSTVLPHCTFSCKTKSRHLLSRRRVCCWSIGVSSCCDSSVYKAAQEKRNQQKVSFFSNMWCAVMVLVHFMSQWQNANISILYISCRSDRMQIYQFCNYQEMLLLQIKSALKLWQKVSHSPQWMMSNKARICKS